jgi:hypothetical protein
MGDDSLRDLDRVRDGGHASGPVDECSDDTREAWTKAFELRVRGYRSEALAYCERTLKLNPGQWRLWGGVRSCTVRQESLPRRGGGFPSRSDPPPLLCVVMGLDRGRVLRAESISESLEVFCGCRVLGARARGLRR